VTDTRARATGLRRAQNEMPADIADLIAKRRLKRAYAERPPYQRNDYLGWIARARRPETRQRRIEQMLEELAGGELYMKMAWRHETSADSRRGGD
jgi:uncharacterized protein YdeI (YjbR/CyaY-like superfamily)